MLSRQRQVNMMKAPQWRSDPRLENMPAVILAGGTGTRLRSVVSDRPKPMASVGSRPFLELQVECLKRQGVRHFVFCVGYLYENIRAHFGDGRDWGVRIDYSIEEKLLGTAGALKQAEKYLRGPFLALNGDSYLNMDLGELLRFHEQKRAMDRGTIGTIVLTSVPDAREFGSVGMDAVQRVVSFVEKSEMASAPALISAGIYMFETELLGRFPAGKKVSLEREVFPSLLESGFRLFGYPAKGFFVDIGTPQGYRRLQEHIQGEVA